MTSTVGASRPSEPGATTAASSETVRSHPLGCESNNSAPLPLGSTTLIAIPATIPAHDPRNRCNATYGQMCRSGSVLVRRGDGRGMRGDQARTFSGGAQLDELLVRLLPDQRG